MTGRFANPEIAFDVPDGWRDCSNTAYVLPESASTTIALDAHTSPGTTVREHAAKLFEHLAATTLAFQVVHRSMFALGAEEAHKLVFDWERSGAPRRNFVVLVVRGGVLWSLRATTPLAELPRTGSAIKQALESFALVGQ